MQPIRGHREWTSIVKFGSADEPWRLHNQRWHTYLKSKFELKAIFCIQASLLTGDKLHFKKSTLDDLLRSVFTEILANGETISTSRKRSRELYGVALELDNPRARLSVTESRGKIFSGLGELFWYLSGSASLDFIKYYIKEYAKESEDGAIVHGAYGPRLFDARGVNQIQNVITQLRDRPRTRRAVVQIFDAADLSRPHGKDRKEIPCTSTLQFLMPNGKLALVVNMRSNDALYGLPHDVFAFTMLQELIARTLGVDIGKYVHFVGSLHLYEDRFDDVEAYIKEGFQDPNLFMPPMPEGDPWEAIRILKSAEKLARDEARLPEEVSGLEPYWQDLARMFLIFAASKKHDEPALRSLGSQMHFNIYSQFIEARIEAASRRPGYQAPLNLEPGGRKP